MVSVGNKSFLFCHMFTMQLQLIKEIGHRSEGGQLLHCTFDMSKMADSSRYVPIQVTFSFIYFYLAGKLKNIGRNTLVQCI